MTSDLNDILKRFRVCEVQELAKRKMGGMRFQAEELAVAMFEGIPDCRERSIALTKLEEAVFWANAAIARNGSE